MLLDQPIHPPNYNMFDCISLESEHRRVMQSTTKLVNYFVTTEYPRIEKQIHNPFFFVHSFFEKNEQTYGNNQTSILDLANQMFSDSKPLTGFEEQVLNATFARLLKNNPTRTNRI
jgi:hypothetical protein